MTLREALNKARRLTQETAEPFAVYRRWEYADWRGDYGYTYVAAPTAERELWEVDGYEWTENA